MSKAAFWWENAACKEDFIGRWIEDRGFKCEARSKCRVRCDADDKRIGTEDIEKVGVQNLKERWSGVGGIEMLKKSVGAK